LSYTYSYIFKNLSYPNYHIFQKMSYAFNKNKKEERETKDFNSFLFFGKRTMHIPLVTTIHSLKFFHQTEDATRV
jgi:hypothetical protein